MPRLIKRTFSFFLASCLSLFAAGAAWGQLTYSVTGSWPNQAHRDAAVAAATAVFDRMNAYGSFTGDTDGNVEIMYNAGVPTAQANYGGNITFGGTYPAQRVMQHELNHWLGSPQHWGNNFVGGAWVGPKLDEIIKMLDGDTAVIKPSGVHFFPYGLNFDTEVTNTNVLPANTAVMYAMRQDMGIGLQTDPWTAAGASTTVTMNQSDAFGRSGFNWYNTWDDGYFAHAGADYFTSDFLLRTPAARGDGSTTDLDFNFTFAGDSLTINNTNGINGGLLYKGQGTIGKLTFNNLILDGGYVRHANGAGDLFRINGLMTVAAGGGTIDAAQGHTNIEASMAGPGALNIVPANFFVRLASSDNTHVGNLNVGGRLELMQDANQRFVIGANGVSNVIAGAAQQVLLNGRFDLDLSGADATLGNAWSLVSSSNTSYGETFEVNRFHYDAGKWRDGTGFAFMPATGQLTFSALPDSTTWLGDTSANWTDNANWSDAPASGDMLVFGAAGAAGTSLTNDRTTPGAFNVAGIAFQSNAPAYTLNAGSGSSGFSLTAGIVNRSSNLQTINDGVATPLDRTKFRTNGGGGVLLVNSGITGAGGVAKVGAGTLTLAGTNTYSGSTRVEGGTLLLTGSLDVATRLDMAGGTFTSLRSGTQAVDGLNVLPGGSTVNNVQAGSSLALGGITRFGGGTVNFGSSAGAITTVAVNTNGVLGPWALHGTGTGTRFATNSGGLVAGYTGATVVPNFGYTSNPNANYDVTGVGAPLGIPRDAHTVRYTGGAATFTAANTVRFTFNALMNAGTGTLTLGDTTALHPAAGSTGELILAAANADIVANHAIVDGDNGTNLTIVGPNTVSLNAANTYSGMTRVNSGSLNLNGGTTGYGDTVLSGDGRMLGHGVVRGDLTANGSSTIRVGEVGLTVGTPQGYSLIDDFNGYPTGGIGATPNSTGDVWTGVFDGTGNAVIVDNANPADKSLRAHGVPSQGAGGWRGAVTDLANNYGLDLSLANGDTATYFYQVMNEGNAYTDTMTGLTASPGSVDINNAWQDFSVMPFVVGNPGSAQLRANGQTVATLVDGQWQNVWVVVDNANKTFDVYTSTGLNAGTLALSDQGFSLQTNPVNLEAFGILAREDGRVRVDNLHVADGENVLNPLVAVLGGRRLVVEGDLTLAEGTSLEIDVASTTAFDWVDVAGVATLNGVLDITLDPSATFSLGDSFTVLTASSLIADGLTLGGSHGGLFSFADSTGTELVLTYSPGLLGDFNGDGIVSLADYTVWRDNLGGDRGATFAVGSYAQTGAVDTQDYLNWKGNFGASLSALASEVSAVPEPSAAMLLIGLAAGGAACRAIRSFSANCSPFAPAKVAGRVRRSPGTALA